MSERVTMPALGESVTEGTVTRWLKEVGDSVEVDEPLLEVSTDKVDTEIPSPVAGTLQEILVEEDETVEVGADLAVIGDGDGGGSTDSADSSDDEPEPEAEPEDTEPEPQPESADDAKDDEQASSDESSSASESSGSSGGEGTTVTMPALGESVTEGTVTRWLKAEGDEVEVDEPLLEVSTDKVDTEIPSPVGGTLTKILVEEDETVEVGADLAIVGGSGSGSAPAGDAEEAPQAKETSSKDEGTDEAASDDLPEDGEGGDVEDQPAGDDPKEKDDSSSSSKHDEVEEAAESPTDAAEAGDEKAATQTAPSGTGQDASSYVTPLVRKLADQHGLDLASIEGTGVGGRIRKQDVLAAAEAKKEKDAPKPQEAAASQAAAPTTSSAPSPAPAAMTSSVSPSKRGTREKMSRLRKVIATRMVESLQVSAQLTTVVEVDMTKVARVRDRVKEEFAQREGAKLSFLPFIALATAEALKVHPVINSSVEGDEIIYHGQENLSIAVDTERGLLTPVVKNAGDLNVAGLARAIADVADRTRNNKITPDDLAGGTFTITNTGSRGALFDTPILNQPQVAMLGTGAIVRRPVVVAAEDGGETIAVRSMMYLALSYDHRVVDGADAARFLGTVKARLEEGAFDA
ncbi:2-oxoglutarate dehydrogenase, E2 component, dihydrolipoamide succinyltransferase [Janibacter sp. GXQ6167]|uniref:2-oxoglutarate dehydrogenase, E2 component, dihydrolipoamide succinyltransferase n=1 Tax=Janibacter sp. GXQ6167 TaxID=3240791 RepID=UPI0035259E7C